MLTLRRKIQRKGRNEAAWLTASGGLGDYVELADGIAVDVADLNRPVEWFVKISHYNLVG